MTEDQRNPEHALVAAEAWLEETFRWGQVNFNEQDPQSLDVGWWARYWADCRLQGVTLNLGGPLAFYPTDVPLHRRSPFIAERDLFGETVAAAKRLGLRVLARLDPTMSTPEIREAHPDWCLTRADGRPFTLAGLLRAATHPGADWLEPESDPLYISCSNSPHYGEFLPAIITEALTRYDIDGIWCNGWPGLAQLGLSVATMCHCRHCLAAWDGEHPGRPLPQRADAADPDWRAYVEFAASGVERVQRRFRDQVAQLKPEATFLSAVFAHPGTSLRWGRWIELVDALGIDAQARPSPGGASNRGPALWAFGQESELSRSVARGKPMLRFIATYMGNEPVFRHAARSPLETRLQMAIALAHGERPKWHTLGGVSHDRRWLPAVREFDEWMAEHDQYLHNLTSVSDVGVVWSPRSVQLETWRGRPAPSYRQALSGWYAALFEKRVPFEYVHEDHLDSLEHLQVLVLPTGLCLSDDAVAAVQRFAERGGAVIACCGALAADEWAQPRTPEPIGALLNVLYTGDRVGPLQHSCLGIGDAGPILTGLGDTDIVGGGGWIVPFAPGAGGASLEGALIPEYATMPTHDVVLPHPRSDVPLFATSRGRGGAAAVYLAADLDAAYGRHAYEDHGRILGNAVAFALAGRGLSVAVAGDGMVDARPWRQPDRRVVFLVNLDNPMLQGGIVRQLRPIGPLEMTIRLHGEQPAGALLLRHDRECEWRQDGDSLVAVVPRVDDFEVVVVDCA